jgi:hypothetical protein
MADASHSSGLRIPAPMFESGKKKQNCTAW